MEQVLRTLLSSETAEWYTPPLYIEAVRRVFDGVIDLDPASNEFANQWIKARKFYTEFDNGLVQPWSGSVFINPPYGKLKNKSQQGLWVKKLLFEYTMMKSVTQAIILVNFVPGYDWWKPLWEGTVCSVDHCIRYVKPDGTQGGKAKASSAFVYFGPNEEKFMQQFSQFGYVGRLRKY